MHSGAPGVLKMISSSMAMVEQWVRGSFGSPWVRTEKVVSPRPSFGFALKNHALSLL